MNVLDREREMRKKESKITPRNWSCAMDEWS